MCWAGGERGSLKERDPGGGYVPTSFLLTHANPPDIKENYQNITGNSKKTTQKTIAENSGFDIKEHYQKSKTVHTNAVRPNLSKPKPKLISRNRSIREYLNKNKRYNNVQGQRSVAKKITPIKSEQEKTTSVEQNTEITSSKPEQQEITMKIQENSIITSSLESTITSNKSEHKITSQDNDEQEIVDYQKKIFVKLKPPSIFEKPKITIKRTKKNIEQDNTSKIYTFFKPINNKETPAIRI